jgi:hypothetical protein
MSEHLAMEKRKLGLGSLSQNQIPRDIYLSVVRTFGTDGCVN